MARKKRVKPVANHPVPKYPLDLLCTEYILLDEEMRDLLSYCVAARKQTLLGVRPYSGYRWCGDHIDLADFRALVHKLLLEGQGYREEDIRAWTFQVLWYYVYIAAKERDQAVDDHWRTELKEAYETGLRYKETWQRLAYEAMLIAQAYVQACQNGKQPARAPFPLLPTATKKSRSVDIKDTAYMALVLGWKLEGLFGVFGTFVPSEVEGKCGKDSPLRPYLEAAIKEAREARLDTLKTFWLHLKEILPKAIDLGAGNDPGQTHPSGKPQNQSTKNDSEENNTQQSDMNPSNQKKTRLSDKEKKALITAELVKNPTAAATEIAEATGIHRTTVSKLWGPLKKAVGEKQRPRPSGCISTPGRPDAVDPASFCNYCEQPLLGSWWCHVCEENVVGECRTCHFTQSHPDKAVP